MESIHPNARIGSGNSFGCGSKIGPNVEIGNNNHIGDYVTISGNVKIGNGNVIGAGSVLGGVSNHVMRKNINNINVVSDGQVIQIGDENLFGEFITVHTPVDTSTIIGNNINIGTRTHIAHNVIIEDSAIISVHCGFGGYVKILKGANVGIGVSIHQRIVIGQYSMIGMGSVVIRHILPSATVVGNPQRYIKPNLIGMQRNKLSTTLIKEMCWYLNEKNVVLSKLSTEAQNVLAHFSDIINNDGFVRDVPFVPSYVTFL